MTLRTKTLTAVAALTIFAGGYALAQDAATTEQPAEAQQPAADAGTSTATPVEDTQPETGATEGEAAEESAADADEAGAEEPAAEAVPAEAEAAESEPAEESAEAATEEPASEAAPAEAEATEAEPADAAEAEEPASDAAATTEEAPAEAETADDAAEEAEATEGEPADAAAEEPAADSVTTEEAPAEAEATEGETAEEPADAATDEPAADEATAEEAPAEEGAADEAATELEAPAEEEHAEADGGHGGHVEDISFSFEGPFGKYDQFQLQRGLQVYTEVCSACHGLKFVPLRTLSDDGGPGLPEDQVRAYAAEMTIIDKETGEERPRLPTDHFPENTGAGAPDLSLMAKARAGFHGPYGTGVNQLVKGIGGPEYIHALLTGYTGEEQEQAGTILYENTAFASGYISMTPPLSDDLVTYEDGTPATVDQMARDVSAFLMWTAEPKLSARKQVGLVSVLFLTLLTALLYLTNKRLWAPHKGKNQAH